MHLKEVREGGVIQKGFKYYPMIKFYLPTYLHLFLKITPLIISHIAWWCNSHWKFKQCNKYVQHMQDSTETFPPDEEAVAAIRSQCLVSSSSSSLLRREIDATTLKENIEGMTPALSLFCPP